MIAAIVLMFLFGTLFGAAMVGAYVHRIDPGRLERLNQQWAREGRDPWRSR